MTRNARLGLAQDVGQLRYGKFRLRQQAEDAQTGLLAGRLQGRIQIVEADREVVCRCVRGGAHGEAFLRGPPVAATFCNVRYT